VAVAGGGPATGRGRDIVGAKTAPVSLVEGNRLSTMIPRIGEATRIANSATIEPVPGQPRAVVRSAGHLALATATRPRVHVSDGHAAHQARIALAAPERAAQLSALGAARIDVSSPVQVWATTGPSITSGF
jgi:hypothetical protein